MSFDVRPCVVQLIASRIKYSGWLQHTVEMRLHNWCPSNKQVLWGAALPSSARQQIVVFLLKIHIQMFTCCRHTQIYTATKLITQHASQNVIYVLQTTVLWNVLPCSLVHRNQRFTRNLMPPRLGYKQQKRPLRLVQQLPCEKPIKIYKTTRRHIPESSNLHIRWTEVCNC